MEFWVSANHARSTGIQLFHGYKMIRQYTSNVKKQSLCKVMPHFLIN